MATINFKEEFKDIVDVNHVQAYCFGATNDMSSDKLIMAGGGNKFSSLCGFKFISKVNPKYNHGEFKIVFCAKLRSRIYRQANTNPSGWFAFLQTRKKSKNGKIQPVVEVLDKQFCKMGFEFDVDKFFQTDFFEKYSEAFKRTATKGVAAVEKMVSDTDASSENEDTFESLPRYIKAIREAIPLISSKTFNDKKYTLTMDFEDPNKKYGNKFDQEKFAKHLKRDIDSTKVKNVLRRESKEEPTVGDLEKSLLAYAMQYNGRVSQKDAESYLRKTYPNAKPEDIRKAIQ